MLSFLFYYIILQKGLLVNFFIFFTTEHAPLVPHHCSILCNILQQIRQSTRYLTPECKSMYRDVYCYKNPNKYQRPGRIIPPVNPRYLEECCFYLWKSTHYMWLLWMDGWMARHEDGCRQASRHMQPWLEFDLSGTYYK